MGLKGMFGSLRQATVLGLEDQSEGPGVMRDEDEGNNRLYWKKREGYCQHCVGHQWSYAMSHYLQQRGYVFCPFVFVCFFRIRFESKKGLVDFLV